MSETTEAEADRMVALARDIGAILDREPDGVLRLSAIATALKIQVFIIAGGQAAALEQIEAVSEIAAEQLVDEWDDLLAQRRRGAN